MAARRRRDNILVAVLAVLAVLGGGHAIFDFLGSDPAAPSTEPAIAVVGRAQLAGAFAEQFVVSYLTAVAGQQDRIGEYVGAAQQLSLPSTARQVSDPVIVYVSRSVSSGPLDVWSVTVSVRVGKNGGSAGDTRQFYRVAVSVTDGRLRALSLPALVQPPGRGADLAMAYSAPCAADTPLAQVATGFLTAFLTSSGEVARYTTPDSGIEGLRPPPFTGLNTVSLTADDVSCGTSGAKAQVLASVTPKGDSGTAATLAYPLTMVRTSGQWQVQSMDSTPALTSPLTVVSNQDSQGGAPTTTTSAPSSTVQIPPAKQN